MTAAASVGLCLLALLAWAGSGQGEVVGREAAGFGECDVFFYQRAPPEPEGLRLGAEQVAKVCQRYRGEPRFATLYSRRDKIPLYAAFRYTGAAAGPAAAEGWLVEPQIDDPGNSLEEMMPEAEITESVDGLGRNQALMSDYTDSGYERGQLNPSSLHKDDHQAATHTLTNAMPMSPPLRELWHWEVKELVSQGLAQHCQNGKDLYLLAGAVPSALMVKDKIAVPGFLWLAACCDNGAESWSVGFIKQAGAEDRLEDLTVEALEKQLPAGAALFKDNCGRERQDPKKLEAVLHTVKKVRAKQPEVHVTKPTQSDHVGAAKEERGFLRNLFYFIVTLPFKLLKFVFSVVSFIVRFVLGLLCCILKKIISMGCIFIKGISKVLLDIFLDVARVGISILNGLAKNINSVLMVTYRILSVPVNLILDIASFPFYTLGAVPAVLQDIASGFGQAFLLLISATTYLVKGLSGVVCHLANRFLPMISS